MLTTNVYISLIQMIRELLNKKKIRRICSKVIGMNPYSDYSQLKAAIIQLFF